jgi:hypothetical protein
MPRIRSIKPEFWEDERIGTLSRDARLLYLGLISLADDEGRFRASSVLLRAQVFPYDHKTDVPAWMDELVAAGRVVRYSFDGETFGAIKTFPRHQKIDRPTPSKLPSPDDPGAIREPSTSPREDSTSPRRALAIDRELSSTDQEGIWKGREGIRSGGDQDLVPGPGPQSASADTRVREVVELWNKEAAPDFGRVKALGPKRPAKIREALKAVPDLEDWRKAIRQLNAWPHAHGKNDTGWVAGFDYLVSNDKHGNLNVLAFSEGAKGGAPKLISKPGFQPLTEVDPLAHVPAGERWKQDYDVVVESGVKP